MFLSFQQADLSLGSCYFMENREPFLLPMKERQKNHVEQKQTFAEA